MWGIPKKRSLSVFYPGGAREWGCGGGRLKQTHTYTRTHTAQTARALQREHGAVSLTTRMGCNLCTLQKREEHYKLLYEIAQVSGEDRPSDGKTVDGGGGEGGGCEGRVCEK